jgi:hypothetical protein
MLHAPKPLHPVIFARGHVTETAALMDAVKGFLF